MPGIRCIYKAALVLVVFLRKPTSSTKSLERQRKNATIHNSLRLIKQTAVWRLESSSHENFGDSAIFPSEKISTSLIEILSSRSHKTPAIYAPLIPTGEALSPSLPQCGVDRYPSWPARFQLRWHLRLRLGNVSKLPFLSACT